VRIALRPVSCGETHTDASARLTAALAERQRRRQQYQDADGDPARLAAAADLAAADEQVAAREAWVCYIEQSQ
jgi:hypothetical protein